MERERTKLNLILSQTNKITFNYEKLKNYLDYEDVFYDNVIKPVAESNNMNIRFKDKYIIFEKKKGD